VADLSGGGGLAIGGLFLARLLPPFVLGPVVGVVADRFERRTILIVTDLLRAVVVLGFLFVRSEQTIWLLYFLTVLQLSISAFFEPPRAAMLPRVVRYDDLVTANTLSSATWSTMLAMGAALGGLTTALVGISAAFLIDATTFLASAWFITRLSPLASKLTGEEVHLERTGWQSFVDGLNYLWSRPTILVLALLKATSALAFGGVEIVQVAYAQSYHLPGSNASATLGLIYLAVGVGTGLGPLLARRITGDTPRPMYWAILMAYLLMIGGYLALGMAASLPVILLATFARTIGTGINWVYSTSLMQMKVPSHYLGRVFAFDMAMMTLASAASTVGAGWAKDSLGWTPAQLALALAAITLPSVGGWAIFMALDLKKQGGPT
jgi:predicted MFS family arabinose efflux permease